MVCLYAPSHSPSGCHASQTLRHSPVVGPLAGGLFGASCMQCEGGRCQASPLRKQHSCPPGERGRRRAGEQIKVHPMALWPRPGLHESSPLPKESPRRWRVAPPPVLPLRSHPTEGTGGWEAARVTRRHFLSRPPANSDEGRARGGRACAGGPWRSEEESEKHGFVASSRTGTTDQTAVLRLAQADLALASRSAVLV